MDSLSWRSSAAGAPGSVRLRFEAEEQRGFPGETVGFSFEIANDSDRPVALRYCLEPEKPLRPASWQVQGPSTVGRGEAARATLMVEVPREGAAVPGRYWLWLKAGPAGSEAPCTLAGECVLVVERLPRLEVLQPPELRPHPDGTLTIALRLLKSRGDADLDLSLKARHPDGWELSCGPPGIRPGVRAGSIDVEVACRPPPGYSVANGDGIDVELRERGRILETCRLRTLTGARRRIRERLASRPGKRNAVVGAAIASAALIASLVIASSPDASPPSSASDLSPASPVVGSVVSLPGGERRDGVPRPAVDRLPVAFHPARLDFRRVPEGGSASREVTIFNRGGVELATGGFRIEGVADFTIFPADPCPKIAAGATCALIITFAPGAEGVRTAALIADHGDADRPARLLLTGVGARAGALP